MKKKIGMVIGASADAIHMINKAKEQDIYVVALDGNPKAEGLKYADKPINVDISNIEKVCDMVEKIKPDFLIPIPLGRCLSTIGYVNDKFGFKGVKYKATELSVDKYLFHQRLYNKGLRNIDLYLVNSKSNFDDIKISYPAIMKPRFGSGSRAIFYISNDDELLEAYRKVSKLDEDFVLEQVIEGIEYGVDGVVINGELYMTFLKEKTITPLPERQAISYFSVVNTEENKPLIERVKNKLKKVVKELEYEDCLVQADIMINDDDVFVIEIAPRPTGHNIYNIFAPTSIGIDIGEEYIKFLLGKSYKFIPDRIKRMQIRYFDFNDVVIKKIPTLDELKSDDDINLIKWNCNIKVGDYMVKVTDGHSIMGRGFFIVEGKNREDLERQSSHILSKFKTIK